MIEPLGGRADPSRFHSTRDPLAEALRFLEARSGGRRPSALVSLAPASDWIAVAADRLWPGTTIASLQADPRFRGLEQASSALRWYPDTPSRIRDFLVRTLEGRLDGGILVVEWRPTLARYPAFAGLAGAELAEALRFLSAARNSERFWARRWLLNSCRNFLRIEAYSSIKPDTRPLLLAAAGPGLEAALDGLADLAGRIRVWALASAAEACVTRGFIPELAFASDPGTWNLLHFRIPERVPIAAPLHARLPPSVVEAGRLVPVELGIFHDAPFLAALGADPVRAAPHGTAAGSAASLATALGVSSLVVAGVDFAADDLREHARPYAFDALDHASEGRIAPAHSKAFMRVASGYPTRMDGRWRASRAFEAYAGVGLPCPVALTLSKSPASPASLPRTTMANARTLLGSPAQPFSPIRGPYRASASAGGRERKLREILERLASDLADGLEGLPPGRDLPEALRQGLEAFCGDRASEWLAERARGTATPALTAATVACFAVSMTEILEELLG